MARSVAAMVLLAVCGSALSQYQQYRPAQHQPPQYQPPSTSRTPPPNQYRPASRPWEPKPIRTVAQPCLGLKARVDLLPGVVDHVTGVVFFEQECPTDPVTVTGHLEGLNQNQKHGMHVHQNSSLENACSGAGPHFNPAMVSHGAQSNGKQDRHVGDLGNIEANYEGKVTIHIVDSIISLHPKPASAHPGYIDNNIMRRAIVVHAMVDDLGLGGDAGSAATGNAGARYACGIIAPDNGARDAPAQNPYY